MQLAWLQACEFDEMNQDVGFASIRHDKRWFCSKYCGGLGLECNTTDSIWDKITSMDLPHDPIALMACVPRLRERFFQPDPHFVEVGGGSANDGDDADAAAATVVTKHLVMSAHSLDQDQVSKFLLSTLCTGLSLEAANTQRVAASLVVISDAGQDLDDEMALVLLRALSDRGLVECQGVIATLAPSRARARLVSGTLNELGLGEIPVGTGSDGGFTQHAASFEETARSYIAPDDDSFPNLSGEELLVKLYTQAAPASLCLLIIASLKDAAHFVRNHQELFKQKTRSVTIMGGVLPFGDDENTPLVPDTAHNNQFCAESSDFLYRRLQELKVPMVIVSRHTAYACPMPRSIYDDMVRGKHGASFGRG